MGDLCHVMGAMEVSDSVRRNLRLVADSGKAGRQFANAGFTLLEILAVIVILGLLSTLAIAIYQNYKKNAMNSAAIATIGTLSEAIMQYRENNDVYPDDLNVIPGGQQLDPWGHPYQYLNIANGGNNW